jgi:hypothetical protein
MPRHPFKKYVAGERLAAIPKEVLNAVVENQRGFVPHPQANVKNLVRDSGIVKVRNDSGAWQPWFSVLGIDAPIITPTDNEREFKREVTFSCSTPEAGTHDGKFVVLLEPIPDGAIGLAVVAGVTQVRLTGADVGRAEIVDGETVLMASAAGGAEVLWAEAGSSERWAIVRIGGVTASFIRGKLDGTMSYQGSATMSIWAWNGSAEADTGDNVTVWDWKLSSGQNIPSGTQVDAAWDPRSGRYYLTGRQCA